jgi:1,2-dihydroxy-3-keto-5-methylthiopentene dioxygenase
MSILTIHSEGDFEPFEYYADPIEISARLRRIGVQFERWQIKELAAEAKGDAVLTAYAEPIEQLKELYGFKTADVISVTPESQDLEALRRKFLAEHTHSDFEVRFFIEGRGLFYLHPDAKVYAVLCEAGDLISVPAGVKHWFDFGERPKLKVIRLFTTPEGWVARYTGSDIADRFPNLEKYLKRMQ